MGSEQFDDLRAARGRTSVSVRRIRSPNGEDPWMPGSADIIRDLQVSYGKAAA